MRRTRDRQRRPPRRDGRWSGLCATSLAISTLLGCGVGAAPDRAPAPRAAIPVAVDLPESAAEQTAAMGGAAGTVFDSGSDPAAPGATDLVRILKARRRLILFTQGVAHAEYAIALGEHPIGPKRQRGDGRTPEGHYVIDWRKPDSDYHRALHISYPNAEDERRAEAMGADPGDSIMIHGLPNGLGAIGPRHILEDWTDGCIAVTNEEIEEIWERVPDGVTVEILP